MSPSWNVGFHHSAVLLSLAQVTRLEPAQARAVFALRTAEKEELVSGEVREETWWWSQPGDTSLLFPREIQLAGTQLSRHIPCGLTWCHKCHFGGFHHSFLPSPYSSSLAHQAWAAAAEQNSQSPQQEFTFSSQNTDISPTCPPDAAPGGCRCLLGLVPELTATSSFSEDAWNCISPWGWLGCVPSNLLKKPGTFCQEGWWLWPWLGVECRHCIYTTKCVLESRTIPKMLCILHLQKKTYSS